MIATTATETMIETADPRSQLEHLSPAGQVVAGGSIYITRYLASPQPFTANSAPAHSSEFLSSLFARSYFSSPGTFAAAVSVSPCRRGASRRANFRDVRASCRTPLTYSHARRAIRETLYRRVITFRACRADPPHFRPRRFTEHPWRAYECTILQHPGVE